MLGGADNPNGELPSYITGADYTEASVTKQEKTALNMARFIRSQTLTLLEKLNELDADEQADICESLHDHADELYRSCLARFGDDGENL